MPFTACCYTISPSFLLQCLVSATQLRSFTPKEECDIIIFCFGEVGDSIGEVINFCNERAIEIVWVPENRLGRLPFGCARLRLTSILPTSYEDIIYLDADTQVSDSIKPLLEASVGNTLLMAAPDPMALALSTPTRIGMSSRKHMCLIGLEGENALRYFNSGVLKFKRKQWQFISDRSIKIIESDRGNLRYLDQDALNISVAGNHSNISLAWNLPGFLGKIGVESRITHFMSNPRPWHGPFHPWGAKSHLPYVEIMRDLPILSNYYFPLRKLSQVRYGLQTPVKRILERGTWNSKAFLEAVKNNEARAVV